MNAYCSIMHITDIVLACKAIQSGSNYVLYHVHVYNIILTSFVFLIKASLDLSLSSDSFTVFGGPVTGTFFLSACMHAKLFSCIQQKNAHSFNARVLVGFMESSAIHWKQCSFELQIRLFMHTLAHACTHANHLRYEVLPVI